jgi:cytochrome c oxidase subunit 2
MITEFAMTPTMTTQEMRETQKIQKKVSRINALRAAKSETLIAKGEDPLEPYEFNYLLLCNKICGESHYNMQINVIVESQEDFDKWMAEQETFGKGKVKK